MSKKVIKKLNQLRELTGRRQPIEQKLLVDIARHIKQLHPEDIDDKVRLGVVLFYQHLIDENCNELVEAVDRHFSDIAECCSAALIADAHNNVANHVIPFLPTPNRIDVRFGNNPYLLQYHYYMLNDFVGNWTHAIQENTDMLFGLVALRYEGELFLNHLTPINLLMICKEFAYLNDIETIKPLVTWCVASNKREALDHFFVSALALGNVEVVEYLLGQFCDFPRDLTLMLRVLQNSIVVPSSALLEKASKRYDVYALLSAALVKHYDYLALALVSIKMDAGLYAQLTIKQRGRLLELATTCLHQAALKAIFKHTAVQAREALYRQHVLLYIPADYQGPQTSIISAVNLLRYYLDTQQFTFSITEEEQNADSFGLHAFGQLLQILAYALGRKGAHCFGALRSEGRHSKLDVSSNIDSEANLISQLKLLGRVDQDAVLGYRCVVTQNDIDETLPKQVDPDVVKLTKFQLMRDDEGEHIRCVPTRPDELVKVCALLQKAYSTIPAYVLNTDFLKTYGLSHNLIVLRKVAQIVWLFSHACVYQNGDTLLPLTVLHITLLLHVGLFPRKQCDIQETSAYSFLTLDAWWQFYPRLFSQQNHADCLDYLTEHASNWDYPGLFRRVAKVCLLDQEVRSADQVCASPRC